MKSYGVEIVTWIENRKFNIFMLRGKYRGGKQENNRLYLYLARQLLNFSRDKQCSDVANYL